MAGPTASRPRSSRKRLRRFAFRAFGTSAPRTASTGAKEPRPRRRPIRMARDRASTAPTREDNANSPHRQRIERPRRCAGPSDPRDERGPQPACDRRPVERVHSARPGHHDAWSDARSDSAARTSAPSARAPPTQPAGRKRAPLPLLATSREPGYGLRGLYRRAIQSTAAPPISTAEVLALCMESGSRRRARLGCRVSGHETGCCGGR